MKRTLVGHSNDDEGFAKTVALELGRDADVDFRPLEANEDPRNEIWCALHDFDLFAFVVSEASLPSLWHRFEIDEAELRLVRGQLKRSLSIVVDDKVEFDDLPKWLRRGKAVRCLSPESAARHIEALVVAPAIGKRPLIGRAKEMRFGTRRLTTSDLPPQLIVASGPEGIGRRAYLEHLLTDSLDLEIGPQFVLNDTSTIEDLYFDCASASSFLTLRDAEEGLSTFREMDSADQTTEIATRLIGLARQGVAPCIVDRDSMLDGRGCYLDAYEELLAKFLDEPDIYLCLVHSRRPDTRSLSFRPRMFEQRLERLAKPDALALVARLLRKADTHPSLAELNALGERIAGYPPTAYCLASQIADRGLDATLADVRRLDELQSGNFAGYVDGLGLADDQNELLAYLANEPTLTLSGIATATDRTIPKTADLVHSLIHLNVIEPVDDEYAISPPIRAAVLKRGAGNLDRRWYEQAFARLEVELRPGDDPLPPASVVDATLRAGLRVGIDHLADCGNLVRPSLLVSTAREKYHASDYERALEYVDRAERMGGASPASLEVKVRSLAHLERFRDARDVLEDQGELGGRRNWYLGGFVERRANEHDQACELFQRGYAAGDHSVSLLRDYADSLLRIGAGEQASSLVRGALERSDNDVFVLDLLARIAIAVEPEDEAKAALARLEEADAERRFAPQRCAWFLILRQGDVEAGRRAASLAAEACKRRDAPVDAYLAWARGLILAGEFAKVGEVRRLLEKKGGESGEAIASLELHEALARGNWLHAEESRLTSRHRDDVTVQIRIAQLKSRDPDLAPGEREAARQEAEALKEAQHGSPTSEGVPWDAF